VLLAADGVGNRRIAELVGASPTTVIAWRERYQERGLAGLADRDRPGRPRELDHRAIVAETLKPPPKKPGVTHWSTRLLADRLEVSNTSIARAWRAYGIKPWKAESFRFSTDPELPFGGIGDSGFGRIHGREGLREFTYAKAIARPRFKPPLALTTFSRTVKADQMLTNVITMLHGRGTTIPKK
jgi:transposase